MSQIVSLRALRPNSTITNALRRTSSAHRLCQYSTFSTSSNQISIVEKNKSLKRTHSVHTMPIHSSSHASVYAFTHHLHTSPEYFDLIDVWTPSVPESVKEGTVRLLKKVEDKVFTDEIIAEVETDKKTFNGDDITSDAQIPKLNTSDDVKLVSENKKDESIDKVNTEQTKEQLSTSSISSKPTHKLTTSTKQQVSAIDTNKIRNTRSETRVKMSRMRIRIAERLKQVQNTCAMLTTFNEINMSNIVEFRKKYADQCLKRHNIKLEFMSTFVKASACALLDNPIVNAAIDGNEIVYRDYVDISVAVATPKGLVVPVLRNVEKMNYADIEHAINEFGEKAKNDSLTIDDMNGGTFTISNGGVFGAPIINPPQSAILGMYGIFDRPVVVNGKMEIRPMMYVALTYDHRILDSRDAVLFLQKIKQYIEDSRTNFLDL
ncbi:unnamed protein product [Rotaria sordida]|uniref:Dihydrolipoyllysine-residue succinyltransferase component of 2-oxoglutarate dehydrogenase complex, mitochondrial n=1 Tax=Rotaria sordida TaxID=392033 RepID=A0A818YMS1_9BILA|nr:unnamed protein product [Rotaria sordida]